jgi:hypothetical protein
VTSRRAGEGDSDHDPRLEQLGAAGRQHGSRVNLKDRLGGLGLGLGLGGARGLETCQPEWDSAGPGTRSPAESGKEESLRPGDSEGA